MKSRNLSTGFLKLSFTKLQMFSKAGMLILFLFVFTTSLFAQPTFVVTQVYNMDSVPEFGTNFFRAVEVDGDSNHVWVGTNGLGLYKFNKTNWEQINDPIFQSHKVRDIKKDTDGDIWVAWSKGSTIQAQVGRITHFETSDFSPANSYSVTNDGLISRAARGLAIAPGDSIWSAHTMETDHNGGVSYFDKIIGPPWSTTTAGMPQFDRDAFAIAVKGTQPWVGVGRDCGGSQCEPPYIVVLNNDGSFSHSYTKDNTPIPFTTSPSPRVTAIYHDSLGNSWVGLSGGAGLARQDTLGNWLMLDANNSGVPSGININEHAIKEDDGYLWFGSNGGLLQYDMELPVDSAASWNLYTTADGLPSNFITGVAVDENGSLWVTTNLGIAFLEKSFLLNPNFEFDEGECVNDNTFFFNTSTPKDSFQISIWDFGDGFKDTVMGEGHILHSFADTGLYDVKLTIFSAQGDSNFIVKSIQIDTVPQLKIKQLDRSPNLSSYDIMVPSALHYYLKVVDDKDSLYNHPFTLFYKFNADTLTSMPSDTTKGLVDLNLQLYGDSWSDPNDDLATANNTYTVSYDRFIGPCSQTVIVENQFSPFTINTIPLNGTKTNGGFGTLSGGASVCVAGCLDLGPWGDLKAIEIGGGVNVGFDVGYKYDIASNGDTLGLRVKLTGKAGLYADAEFGKFNIENLPYNATLSGTAAAINYNGSGSEYIETFIDWKLSGLDKYMQALYYLSDGAYHQTKGIGSLNLFMLRLLIGKYLSSQSITPDFASYGNSYTVNGSLGSKANLNFALKEFDFGAGAGLKLGVDVGVNVGVNSGYEVGTSIEKNGGLITQTTSFNQYGGYSFNITAGAANSLNADPVTIGLSLPNVKLVTGGKQRGYNFERRRGEKQGATINMVGAYEESLSLGELIKEEKKSINLAKKVTDHLGAVAPNNDIVAFLDGKDVDFSFNPLNTISGSPLVEIDDLIKKTRAAYPNNQNWKARDFTVDETRAYAKTQKYGLNLEISRAAGLAGVTLKGGIEVGVYGNTEYPISNSMFLIEMDTFVPILEFPRDGDFETLFPSPTEITVVEDLMDAIVSIYNASIQKLKEFGSFLKEAAKDIILNHTILSNLGLGRELLKDALFRGMAEKMSQDDISTLQISYPNDGSVFPMDADSRMQLFYPAGLSMEITENQADTFLVISDYFFFEAWNATDTFDIAPNGDFEVITCVGKDDLTFLGLDTSSTVELFHLGNQDTLWKSVGMGGDTLDLNGLGVYALGVRMMTDTVQPVITIPVIADTLTFLDSITFEITDAISGVKWESVQCIVDGEQIPVGRIDQSSQGFILINDFPTGLDTNVQVLLVAMDRFRNTNYTVLEVDVDLLVPEAICQDITTYLEATGNSTILPAQIDNGSNDNYGIDSLSLNIEDFNCNHVGIISTTLTVTDLNGLTASCMANVTVQDTVSPTAMCQNNLVLDLPASGEIEITVAQIDNGSSDACTLSSSVLSKTKFTCDDVGNQLVTLTVTDVNNNESSCQTTLTIQDKIISNIQCKDYTLQLDAQGMGSLQASDIDDGSNDACGIQSLQIDKTNFTCMDIGTHQVTLTIQDKNGNSENCTATVTVEDKEQPNALCKDTTLVLPTPMSSFTLTADDLDAGSTDACGIMSKSIDQTVFGAAQSGINLVTLTVTDIYNNVGTCISTVTVLGIDFDLDGQIKRENGDPVENVDVQLSGDLMETLMTDANGDYSRVQIPRNSDFTITPGKDDGDQECLTVKDLILIEQIHFGILPSATPYQIIAADVNKSNAITSFDYIQARQVLLGINDKFPDNEAWRFVPEHYVFPEPMNPFSTAHPPFPESVNIPDLMMDETVNFIAIKTGEPSNCDEMIQPGDLEFEMRDDLVLPGETIAVPMRVNNFMEYLGYQGSIQWDPTALEFKSIDNLALAGLTQAWFGTHNAATGQLTFGWHDVNLTGESLTDSTAVFELVFEVIGNPGTTTMVTFEDNPLELLAVNTNMNVLDINTTNATITIVDQFFKFEYNGADTFSVDANCLGTFDLGGVLPTVLPEVPAIQFVINDYLDVAATGYDWNDPVPVNTTVTVVWTAMDNFNNEASFLFDVHFIDDAPPDLNCQNFTVELDANGNGTVIATDFDPNLSDNCGIQSTSVVPNTFDCSHVGSNLVTVTVLDVNDNSSSCMTNAMIQDNIAPHAICKDITIQLNVNGLASITASDVDDNSTDACGIQSQMLDTNTFDCQHVGANTATLTITDMNDNSADCQAIVTVQDNVPPIVLCQDLTVQLDQNGSATVTAQEIDNNSTDACGIQNLSLNQTSFNCNQVGQNTVTLTVEDVNMNTATCNSIVTVVDEVHPSINCPPALIAICDISEIPAYNFVSEFINNGGLATDNCEIDNDGIQFVSDVSDGMSCPETVTRTYEISDVNGNTASCTQTITINDEILPEAICQNISVLLDASGNASVNAQMVNGGSTDNCGNIALSASISNFDCNQIGPRTTTLTVTDDCGNENSCNADVAVIYSDGCPLPELKNENGPIISDPCICRTNGEFDEEVHLEAPSGQGNTWVIKSTTLLDPNTMQVLAIGTVLTEYPLGNGFSKYAIAGIHLDGIGYEIFVENPTYYPNVILSISNTCYYPKPEIEGFDNAICLFTNPFDLQGNAGGVELDSEMFTINNLPATQVDPLVLGIGIHTVTFTVDAGTAASMSMADPGCVASTSKTFEIFETPEQVVCNALVQVAMDENCEAYLNPDLVLEGTYFCEDDYLVEVFDDNISLGDVLNGNYLGQILTFKVSHQPSGNFCWGELILEDKMPPVVDCAGNYDVSCSENIESSAFYPSVSDNCDAQPFLQLTDETIADNDICDDGNVVIQRTWAATDDAGNQSQACIDLINISRPEVNFPESVTWTCEAYNANDNVIDVQQSGEPTGIQGTYCQYGISHADQTLDDCGSTFKIIRTWTVVDWCTNEIITLGANGKDNVQTIGILDTQAPEIQSEFIQLNANVTATHPQSCSSTGFIPAAEVMDNCANWTLKIFSPIGELNYANGQNGNEGGSIPSPGLELGSHEIIFQAEDECGNVSEFSTILEVVDNQAPSAICDELTEVTLSSDGLATINAEDLDDGSHDNCCLDYFVAKKMEESCGNSDFESTLTFCCEDVKSSAIGVILRVFDCHGNYNECMIQVVVDDKVVPQLLDCPGPQTITCDDWMDDLQTAYQLGDQSVFDVFGNPEYTDNCGQSVDYQVNVNLDNCGVGSISRIWQAEDANPANPPITCTQIIRVEHVSDWVVSFPEDLTATCGQSAPDFGEPEIFQESCELIAVSFEDQVFDVVPDACYKITRNWTVINWCAVGSDLDQETVEEPESQLGLLFPDCDLDGDGDCDERTFQDSRTATGISDTDPDADEQDGYIIYQQTIKVIDEVVPVLTCESLKICLEENTCETGLSIPLPNVIDCSSNISITAISDLPNFNQSSFTANEVSPGNYLLTYTATDNCGNSSSCQIDVEVSDCKKPTPYCKSGLIVTLMPNSESVTVWASDLNDGSFDNCSEDLQFSFSSDSNDDIRIFNCPDVGGNLVEIWVSDAAGNQDFCNTAIQVQATMGACEQSPLTIGGLILTTDNEAVEQVNVNLNGSINSDFTTEEDGIYLFDDLELANDYSIQPEKNDDLLNGVTTFDLVLITKHILGTKKLDSPYKMIAADVNHSNAITTFDLVALRKAILFVSDEFPNNDSWRFVDTSYEFPNEQNPWQEGFPEVISLNNVEENVINADFVAIKIGDVNHSALPNSFAESEERNQGKSLVMKTKEQELVAGNNYEIDFRAMLSGIEGFQYSIVFNSQVVDFKGFIPALLKNQNMGFTLLEQGIITVSWNDISDNTELFTLEFQAKKSGKLSEVLTINSRFTPAEAYAQNGELYDIELQFEIEQEVFSLSQNQPNPFSESTHISFYLPKDNFAVLTIYDVNGQEIKSIKDNFHKGNNQVLIGHQDLPAKGIYYYQLNAERFSATRKMILIE